jgi:hypothetical protein
MEDAFASVLGPLAKDQPDFEHISRLCIGVTVSHPTMLSSSSGRRSYSKSIGTYFVSVPVDYALFVSRSWDKRTDAFADAIKKASMRVPKSRITESERSMLNELVEQSRSIVRRSPPANVHEVKAIQIHLDESSRPLRVDYAPLPSMPSSAHVIEVLPGADLSAWLRTSMAAPTGEVSISKLYKRDDGRLHYYETWRADGPVIEHWGVCGERGRVREHPVAGDLEAKEIVKKLRKQAKANGFRALPQSRHAMLTVEYPIDGFGHDSDLSRRHEIEGFLDQQTGWMGLGHCDGGSTGAGTMEVFCAVVDFDIAKAALERELSASPHGNYQRIYRSR